MDEEEFLKFEKKLPVLPLKDLGPDEILWRDPRLFIMPLIFRRPPWYVTTGAWITLCFRRNKCEPILIKDLLEFYYYNPSTYGRWSGLLNESLLAMRAPGLPVPLIDYLYYSKNEEYIIVLQQAVNAYLEVTKTKFKANGREIKI